MTFRIFAVFATITAFSVFSQDVSNSSAEDNAENAGMNEIKSIAGEKTNPADDSQNALKQNAAGSEKKEKVNIKYSETMKNAPDDPSLLYENRFIPDMPVSDGSLDPAIERNVIIEEIKKTEDEHNFTLKLPNLTQSLMVVGILIIFILYRMKVKKGAQKRR